MVVISTLSNLTDPAERGKAEEQAARCLREGGLVILPTETVYGVFADASNPEAMERLDRLTIPTGERPPRYRYTWHAPTVDSVLEAVPVPHASHRLLMRRLLPGPVRFDIRMENGDMLGVVDRLGVEPGVLEHDGTLAVRVPAQPVTQRVLGLVGAPVVANRLSTAGWTPDRTPEAAIAAAEEAGVCMIIDDGPAKFGLPSSLVRLLPDGGYLVEAEGAYDTRMIEKKARMQILFVCTGNTCRSPMAEAIARSLTSEFQAESAGSSVGLTVLSAGTSAGSGSPASPQTGAALRSLGVEPSPHRSRPLSRTLVAESDVIFTMSGWHRDEVIALDPTAASRAYLLDPQGQDVPDPVGLPQEVYDQTAARLRELITQRLTEFGLLAPAGKEAR